MMEKEKGLHELYQYLANYIDLKALIVLSLDVTVDVHA